MLEKKFSLLATQHAPCTRRDFDGSELANADANQAQRGMTYGGGHAADLPVFAFD
jgi:hypothetical protein